MSDYIDCTNNQLTDEQLVKSMTTKNTSGEAAIRVVFVDGNSLEANDCSNNGQTLKQLFRRLVGLAGTKPAIRLALPNGGTFLNDIQSYANDAAAAAGSPAIPVGGIYYKTGVGLHTRMS